LTELAIVAVMRTRRRLYESLPGPLLFWLSGAVAIAVLCLPYAPFAHLLGFVPLAWPVLLSLVAIALAYTLASELLKTRLGSLARAVGKWFRSRRLPLPRG
jgi:Mg2+-importing ATPase